MGAFAAVARGSHNAPRLIVLRHEPPEPAPPGLHLGLVGKAITFDSGGISLKPALRMEDMKGDMAGPGFVRRKRPDYILDQGGTGYGVRLIVELAQRLAG